MYSVNETWASSIACLRTACVTSVPRETAAAASKTALASTNTRNSVIERERFSVMFGVANSAAAPLPQYRPLYAVALTQMGYRIWPVPGA